MIKKVQSKIIVNESLSEQFCMESKGRYLIEVNNWQLAF